MRRNVKEALFFPPQLHQFLLLFYRPTTEILLSLSSMFTFCLVLESAQLLVVDNDHVTICMSRDGRLPIISNMFDFIWTSRLEKDWFKTARTATLHQTIEMTGARLDSRKILMILFRLCKFVCDNEIGWKVGRCKVGISRPRAILPSNPPAILILHASG